MRVEKWYLDSVTAEGAGLIGYAARVSWGVMAVRCCESLVWEANQSPATDRIVLGGSLPEESGEEIRWQQPALGIAGTWSRVGAGLPPVVLHAEAAGRIEWRCGQPAARVAVDVAGRRNEGLGYAEQLVVTLPAARLPVRQLIWGRFVAAETSCVWIRWRGAVARSWCFHDGHAVTAEFGEGPGLSWPGHRLQLEAGAMLRDGRVADTVFNGAPWLRRLFPSALGDVVETKWCARGALIDDQGRRHDGWAIHEVANFP